MAASLWRKVRMFLPARTRADARQVPAYLRAPYAGHRLVRLVRVRHLMSQLPAGSDEVWYLEHAEEKVWIADYSAGTLESVLAGMPTKERAPWGMRVPGGAHLFACVGELVSVLDNLSFVANRVAGIGIPDHQIDFRRLMTSPAATTWRTSAAGAIATAFLSDPWTDYLYELRNRLTHHAFFHQTTVAMFPGPAYGLLLPPPGAPGNAGGGPDAREVLPVLVELVSRFADDFCLAINVTT